MIRLGSLTSPELIFPHLPGSDIPTVLRAFAERLVELSFVGNAEELYSKLWEREQLGSTGIGSGVAIPHCKVEHLERAILAIGVADQGVEFGSVDGQPVRLFFLVVSPSNAPAEHLQVLAAISKWVKADHHAGRILESPSRESIYALLDQEGG